MRWKTLEMLYSYNHIMDVLCLLDLEEPLVSQAHCWVMTEKEG